MATRRKGRGKKEDVVSASSSKITAGSSCGESKKNTEDLKKAKQILENNSNNNNNNNSNKAVVAWMKEGHLVPLTLVIVIFVCSGPFWVLSFRDLTSTGKIIFGQQDEAMLTFTKSMAWFDDSKGWKSSQGGFSAVMQMTTDENNMGGFFVRKLAGAASLTFYSQKILPFIFQSDDAHWISGHFTPLYSTSVIGNLAVIAFYLTYMDDLQAADAQMYGFATIFLLSIETLVLIAFLLPTTKQHQQKPIKSWQTALTKNRPARGVVSKIMMRTILIVTGLISIIAARDLLFPGSHIDIIPRDDIYLEWTNAFIHSPPPFSHEGEEHGLEAPLFIGDKFISQLASLYLLINCFQKFVTAFIIRIGKDGSGESKCRMIWKVQAWGDALLTFTFRVFAAASLSASLDLRWHLMCLGYETFMLFLYGYA